MALPIRGVDGDDDRVPHTGKEWLLYYYTKHTLYTYTLHSYTPLCHIYTYPTHLTHHTQYTPSYIHRTLYYIHPLDCPPIQQVRAPRERPCIRRCSCPSPSRLLPSHTAVCGRRVQAVGS